MSLRRLLFALGLIGAVALAPNLASELRESFVDKSSDKDFHQPTRVTFQQVYRFGYRLPGDRLNTTAYVVRRARPFETIYLPQIFAIDSTSNPRRKNITQVVVTNRIPNETKTTVELRTGGQGYPWVTFIFRGEQGKSINYKVEIFAK